MSTKALLKAVRIAGSQSELARRVSSITGKKVKQGHVWWWLNKAKGVPPSEYLKAIVEASEKGISVDDLLDPDDKETEARMTAFPFPHPIQHQS